MLTIVLKQFSPISILFVYYSCRTVLCGSYFINFITALPIISGVARTIFADYCKRRFHAIDTPKWRLNSVIRSGSSNSCFSVNRVVSHCFVRNFNRCIIIEDPVDFVKIHITYPNLHNLIFGCFQLEKLRWLLGSCTTASTTLIRRQLA